MNYPLKIFLALALFGCLLDMPYTYFILVRFATFAICGYLAYVAYKDQRMSAVWIYLGIALLFQPFLKISFHRITWNILDVLLAIYLVINVLWNPLRPHKKE